ncbi:MAG: hypothetical protein ACAI35_20010 [Candidatus Methylacidiphilales bacterium]|nr:hypothetical protein [Candidatus Methylacidiphilales bacterium]
MHAAQPAAFTASEPPLWVSEWLASREERAAKAVEKEEKKKAKEEAITNDPKAAEAAVAAAEKRARQREEKVQDGLSEMELWLLDGIRTGFASLQSQPSSFWSSKAARLVDAQAAGISRRVGDLSGIPVSGKGWQERLLAEFSSLYMLRRGYESTSVATLSDSIQAGADQIATGMAKENVRLQIGWTIRKEDVLATAPLQDSWICLGSRINEEDRLRVLSTWLVGRQSGRFALLLSFAVNAQPFEIEFSPGMEQNAALCFYPGELPLRAIVSQKGNIVSNVAMNPPVQSVAQSLTAYAGWLATDPWLRTGPFVLDVLIGPPSDNEGWRVIDRSGDILPIASSFSDSWRLLALAGGEFCPVAAEWDGSSIRPLCIWAEGRCHLLGGASTQLASA